MSTLAVFLAFGGTAAALVAGEVKSKHIDENAVKSKHIARGAATGADVRESSLRGIGAGVVGGSWDDTGGAGLGGHALSATGSTPPITNMLAPTKIKLVNFRVKLLYKQTQGIRSFHVQSRVFGSDDLSRALCTIRPGESSCTSRRPLTLPAGTRFGFWVSYSDTAPDSPAYYGWRAVTP